MVKVEKKRIHVDTRTLAAVFENGALRSLVRKSDGREFLGGPGKAHAALDLVYAGNEAAPLGGEPGDGVTCLQLNDRSAEMRFSAWNGDGVISVGEDEASGDLVVEPSACSSRPGLRACRWNLAGAAKDLRLVAPLFQGIRLPLEDPLIRDKKWRWPHGWEAGLAILEGGDGGFWVHCRDERYRYKALQTASSGEERCLGFETESYGPLHDNLAAGGLPWRINVYEGDWQVPAASYRDWLASTVAPAEARRPDWLPDVRFAVSWCPCDEGLLDALARRLSPGRVLLHVPRWRSDAYDQNYPTFAASSQGRAFIKRAQTMGFRTMPHFNAIDMDPTHPVYAYVRDFQYRELESRRVQGWTYHEGEIKPVPESNAARGRHQDKNTMIKVHPGLALWRSILAENVRKAAEELFLDTVFLDVTLNTWNLHNCLVENTTPSEGMKRLIAQVASLGGGLAVGGEGRNEVTMQGQSVAQVHLFESWQQSADGLERTGGCALNEFLFGGLCRSFGYSRLSGKTPDEELRMKTHVSLGAIPTVTVRSAEEIERPNRGVTQMLDLARD